MQDLSKYRYVNIYRDRKQFLFNVIKSISNFENKLTDKFDKMELTQSPFFKYSLFGFNKY